MLTCTQCRSRAAQGSLAQGTTTPQFNYLSGQNATEHNPALSPSGHPLLSGPPT